MDTELRDGHRFAAGQPDPVPGTRYSWLRRLPRPGGLERQQAGLARGTRCSAGDVHQAGTPHRPPAKHCHAHTRSHPRRWPGSGKWGTPTPPAAGRCEWGSLRSRAGAGEGRRRCAQQRPSTPRATQAIGRITGRLHWCRKLAFLAAYWQPCTAPPAGTRRCKAPPAGMRHAVPPRTGHDSSGGQLTVRRQRAVSVQDQALALLQRAIGLGLAAALSSARHGRGGMRGAVDVWRRRRRRRRAAENPGPGCGPTARQAVPAPITLAPTCPLLQ